MIPMTSGYTTMIDDEDAERLQLTYAYARHSQSATYAYNEGGDIHRQVMNAKEGEIVDHINFDTLDNRKSNLRICTNRESLLHRRKWHKGVAISRYKGVKPNTGGWLARGNCDEKCINIGNFNTEKEAAHAYDLFAIKHYGDYANLNFPEFDYSGYVAVPRKRKTVAVELLSPDLKPIAFYWSLSEAEQATGIDHSHIRKICIGKCNSTRGFNFRFAEAA